MTNSAEFKLQTNTAYDERRVLENNWRVTEYKPEINTKISKNEKLEIHMPSVIR